ncbi:MAG: hypothetical protein ABSF51_13720 [Verrucomicrobiota bacterium]|jgi:hypothetical protein
MDPLATYEQRFAGVRRRFELYSDHLAIHGRKFGATFDVRHELSHLSEQFDQARIRAPLFHGGLILIIITLVGVVILGFNGGLMMMPLVVMGIIAVMGIACVLVRPRPLRVCMFKNKTGDYVFEIVGAGPDAGRVEQFISLVTQQVQRANLEV